MEGCALPPAPYICVRLSHFWGGGEALLFIFVIPGCHLCPDWLSCSWFLMVQMSSMGLQTAAVGEHRVETYIETRTQFWAVVWPSAFIGWKAAVVSLAFCIGSAGQEGLVLMHVINILNKLLYIKNSACPGQGWSLQLLQEWYLHGLSS